MPEIGNLDYAAAKLPLLALSSSLATEFSPRGIRSNVVNAGPTRTPLYDRPGGFSEQIAEIWGIDKESAIARMEERTLTRRLGQADDVAQVIAYLVSPLSRQVTAAEWSVDGGAHHRLQVDRVMALLAVREDDLAHLPEGLRRVVDGERGTRISLEGLEVADLQTLGAVRLSSRRRTIRCRLRIT
jgi:NAD(P)-dependent dehydrogenase (short-subunit alcohol dehydrogenase family)